MWSTLKGSRQNQLVGACRSVSLFIHSFFVRLLCLIFVCLFIVRVLCSILALFMCSFKLVRQILKEI